MGVSRFGQRSGMFVPRTITDDLVASFALDMAARSQYTMDLVHWDSTHAAKPTPQASFSSSGS